MKEVFEFRINYEYASKLFDLDEGRDLGQIKKSVKVITIGRDDPRFGRIPLVAAEIKERYDKTFYYSWRVRRKYSKKELEAARICQLKIKQIFEPAGEECGTMYDETMVCEICGSGKKQVGSLILKENSIPKTDIASTIAGEVVVSKKLKDCFQKHNLKGLSFNSVFFRNAKSEVYQPITTSPKLELTPSTKAGIDPFDFSEKSKGEIYKCPKGHTLGLNLLSEAYIGDSGALNDYDFFITSEKIGVKRGLLRPQPLYLCSQAFRKMAEQEKLSGFYFEIANIES